MAHGLPAVFELPRLPVADLASSPGLAATCSALLRVLEDHVERDLPHRRIARLSGLLALTGVPIEPALGRRVRTHLLARRRADGAWTDCEDTAWCLFALAGLDRGHDPLRAAACGWLERERCGAGWGFCARDDASIPMTSQVRLLVPELADEPSAQWLAGACARELAGRHVLSYKLAWYLLAGSGPDTEGGPTARALDALLADQRASGGFGPWREHPAPDDCFATGLALWALSQRAHDERVGEALERGTVWCTRQQLADGLFPTHYIEEGSAWVALGWSAALRAREAV